MGPPAGHPVHRRAFGGPVIFYDTPPCPVCGVVECAAPLSKTMLGFDGDSRHMSDTRHAGHTVTYRCNKTRQPEFLGLPGRSLETRRCGTLWCTPRGAAPTQTSPPCRPHSPLAAYPQSHPMRPRHNDHSMGWEGQGGPPCSCCEPCRHCSCKTHSNSYRRHAAGSISSIIGHC